MKPSDISLFLVSIATIAVGLTLDKATRDIRDLDRRLKAVEERAKPVQKPPSPVSELGPCLASDGCVELKRYYGPWPPADLSPQARRMPGAQQSQKRTESQ